MNGDRCTVEICVGAGGVGKTTISSMLGLSSALLGKRTLVITVDPARRLFDALGLKGRGGRPIRVNIPKVLGDRVASGELFALMPDLRSEWLDFLSASIKVADLRHEIASNYFYRYMTDGLPGAFEIICSHLMFRLLQSGEYDHIILDTAPSSQSIAFFDVPQKISHVLEQGLFQSLMRRRHTFLLRLTKKLAFFSSNILEKTLERLIGSHFLSEMIDFALTIDALYEPLLVRARAMDALLKDKKTKFVLVLRPTFQSINDCFYLSDSLAARGISIQRLVINQVLPEVDIAIINKELENVTNIVDNDVCESLEGAIKLYVDQMAAERRCMKRLNKKFIGVKKYILESVDQRHRQELLRNLLNSYESQMVL